jgi:hypothetical protein
MPGATSELSAPLLRKHVLRLAVSAGFEPHNNDFQVFLKKRASPSAHRNLAVEIWENPEKEPVMAMTHACMPQAASA